MKLDKHVPVLGDSGSLKKGKSTGSKRSNQGNPVKKVNVMDGPEIFVQYNTGHKLYVSFNIGFPLSLLSYVENMKHLPFCSRTSSPHRRDSGVFLTYCLFLH